MQLPNRLSQNGYTSAFFIFFFERETEQGICELISTGLSSGKELKSDRKDSEAKWGFFPKIKKHLKKTH